MYVRIIQKDQERNMIEIIYPVKVKFSSENAKNADILLHEHDLQIGLNENELCTIPPSEYIILDFGMEYSGGVRFLAFDGSNSVRLRLGESLGECCAELGEDGACNDHSLRDLTVEVPRFSDNEYFKSAFRFLRIDNNGDTALSLKAVVLTYNHADVEQIGSFECNDETVNDIFNAAVRTMHLNMQNGVLYDGVKRDRLVWIADIHPEELAYLGLYNDYSFIKNSIEHLIAQTELPRYMNNIPAYSNWFIIAFYEYVFHTGDIDFLNKHKQYVIDTIEYLATSIDDEGVLHVPYDYVFFDWPTHHAKDGGFAGNVVLWYLGMNIGRKLMDIIGVDSSKIAKKAKLIYERYPESCDYKQGAGMRIYAGMDQDGSVLTQNGAKGFSTLLSYYILYAIFKSSGSSIAIDLMKEYYGTMLSLGATTFFEDFNIDWAINAARIDEFPKDGQIEMHRKYGDFCYVGYRHSLCHGWSAGPVQFLQRCVAGIEVLDIGCKKISVKPDIGSLEWIKCTFPTPYGKLSVYCDKNGTTIDAPDGIEILR